MFAIEECRKNAEECLGWARTARTDEDRAAFLDMARTWTQAALMAEGASLGIAEILPTRKRSQAPAD